ncbi:MAG TPA: glycosyltransferase family 39 protein [Candidatus Saccharimonadales bacterium]|nr:glycosyltransferase family 39 protein [Candidatus Saccharimonadales bacterium]
MKSLQKNKWVAIAFIGLIILYFFTRLYHLSTFLPIFTDEAIYIHWSQIALNDASWRFISLTDGKQPMYVWLALIFLKLIHDPLAAGRMVSVAAGFFSMIGIFFLGRELFKNTKIGMLASLLYVLYPFALVYDKMALYDSLVAMFTIWIFYFSILLVRYVRLDLGMILGIVAGLGMLTKTNVNLALGMLPFTLVLFPFKKKFDKNRLFHWTIYALVAVFIANVMYQILRLSPFFYIIAQKNLTFIYSFHDWIREPFAFFYGNFKGLFGWFIEYMTIPFLVVTIVACIVDKKNWKEKVLLCAWFIFPFIALAFFGKVIYPRFILFMTIPILVLGAYALFILMNKIKQTGLKILLALIFVSMFLVNDFFILTNFPRAFIASGDQDQLYYGWSSGVGVQQTVDYLQEQAKHGKIYVGTEGTFGLMPYALQIYLDKNPNIMTQGFWPMESIPPKELTDASKKMPTYIIFYQSCPTCTAIGKAPTTWPVTQIFSIKKLAPNTYYTLYRVNP